MDIRKISSSETSILKALSIVIIALHNSLHPFFPVTVNGGNEFDFAPTRIQAFTQEVGANILSLPNMLLACFGYCAVFLFFFLSAYGITTKHGDTEDVPYLGFVGKRVTKILLPVLAISVFTLLFLIAGGNQYGSLKDITASNFLLRLSMLSNFSFDQTWKVIGPWWFLSTIIQFYFIFHVINWGQKKFGDWFYIVISALSMAVLFFLNSPLYDGEIIALRATIIGWLPEISLGCYFARTDRINIGTAKAIFLALLCLLLFALGNIFESLWVFSSMAILLFMILVARPVLNTIECSETFTRFLVYTGNISVYMFLLSGIIREPFVHTEGLQYWQQSIVAIVLTVANFIISACLFYFQNMFISMIKRADHIFHIEEQARERKISFDLMAIIVLALVVAVELFFI
jgi:peptidoglycan/LPS O-acetylase OafA/YrhL